MSQINNTYRNKFNSEEFINQMDDSELPFGSKWKYEEESIEQPKVDNTIKVYARRVFNSNSESSRGVYNVNVGGFITIKSVRLYYNNKNGQMFIVMPSFKTKHDKYMSYIDVKGKLHDAILNACIYESQK